VRVQVKLACQSSLREFQNLRTNRFFNSCSTFEKQEVCYIFQKLFEVTVSHTLFYNFRAYCLLDKAYIFFIPYTPSHIACI
jgi:hypothetical protein